MQLSTAERGALDAALRRNAKQLEQELSSAHEGPWKESLLQEIAAFESAARKLGITVSVRRNVKGNEHG